MNFNNVKKTFNKANQLFSEKVGSVKGTSLESDYLESERRIDVYKELFDAMLSKTTEYLQPNPAHRAKLMTVNVLHKMQKQNSQKALYPQIEGQMADMFKRHGTEIADTAFGQSLNSCGESFKELEEIKYSLEDYLKQNFIEPIMHLRNNDLKEITTLRKKVQSRRLNFDGLKRSKEKGSKISEEELQEAERKFDEAKEMSMDAMNNFLSREKEHINLLGEFMKAEKEYHTQAGDILDQLHNQILSFRNDAASNTNSKRNSSMTSGAAGKSPMSNENFTYTAPVIKKAHESNSAIPSCRALYLFEAETENELSFNEGDIIKLIQRVDENWYEGEIRGEVGFFPVNFVEVLIPLKD